MQVKVTNPSVPMIRMPFHLKKDECLRALLLFRTDSMQVYTYQIAKWRAVRAKRIPMLDTTVKSGEGMLAPTWNMVMGHKAGTVSDQEYEELYFQLLGDRYHAYPEYFEWLLAHDRLALGCYCKAGNFCHRLLIVKFLKQISDEVEDCGEIQ
ncbi:hypothetical protein AVT69_gp172 [Pseudomonas phage PhiPA3]|uniref:Uncharacterized protein 174 n=1 Tax=Pseudomonas phage PhiPA3 TaxID=998086 RepID=F8SK47_BPPA3|nr:hypothetical protein AVT69_gp172 [Pseudomonas phage PhiPA3]AEH03597.1 hypothetical protein [Pseudomonas phage PhiPA3]